MISSLVLKEKTTDSRVAKVRALMKSNLCLRRSLPKLAQAVNLSPSRLRSLFKLETGKSPARYLKLLRMEAARELLEHEFLSIKQVARRVGFEDLSHFVRDFEKTFGLAPARYRAAYLDRHSKRKQVLAKEPQQEVEHD